MIIIKLEKKNYSMNLILLNVVYRANAERLKKRKKLRFNNKKRSVVPRLSYTRYLNNQIIHNIVIVKLKSL